MSSPDGETVLFRSVIPRWSAPPVNGNTGARVAEPIFREARRVQKGMGDKEGMPIVSDIFEGIG